MEGEETGPPQNAAQQKAANRKARAQRAARRSRDQASSSFRVNRIAHTNEVRPALISLSHALLLHLPTLVVTLCSIPHASQEERETLQKYAEYSTQNVSRNRRSQAVSVLLQAAKGGHTDVCVHAVSPGPAGGVAVPIDSEDEWGNTALILASLGGKHETVETLLDLGANPNKQNVWAGTALIEGASRGFHDVVRLLLKRGSNVDAQNRVGNTSLSLAVRSYRPAS